MEGVTGTMAWLGHVPARRRGGVYGHADIDKPFFSYRANYLKWNPPAAPSASCCFRSPPLKLASPAVTDGAAPVRAAIVCNGASGA